MNMKSQAGHQVHSHGDADADAPRHSHDQG